MKKHELTELLLKREENDERHIGHSDENSFYNQIASGNLEAVHLMADGPRDIHMYEREGYGRLSADPLKNMRYHFVTAVALITRHCAEHGLPWETAYTLSDLYINRMDAMNSMEEIAALHSEMLLEYTGRMAALPKQKIYSLQVVNAMNYIVNNQNKKLNAEIVAKELNMNRSYLSRLFAAETGEAIGAYIRNEKLKQAADMLKFTEYSCPEVSEYLHFSSQSHFIKRFREKYGMTPLQYKKMNASLNPVY